MVSIPDTATAGGFADLEFTAISTLDDEVPPALLESCIGELGATAAEPVPCSATARSGFGEGRLSSGGGSWSVDDGCQSAAPILLPHGVGDSFGHFDGGVAVFGGRGLETGATGVRPSGLRTWRTPARTNRTQE